MNMKKMMMVLAAGSLAIAAQGLTLSVKDVKIAQRYPWNGLVDIDYTVVCDEPATNIWVYPVGYDADFNVSVAPRTLEGDGANGQPVTVGAGGEKAFRMTWNMGADMPANYNRAKFSMKMHAYAGAAPYMVINLEPGPEATKYDVDYLMEIPDVEWPIEYKTSKLVLKLVCPGTFMMGSPVEEEGRSTDTARETQHKVTITQPFYMGVFEVTQKQYELVMGQNPSSQTGESRPVEQVSYDMIRGNTLGAKWPAHRQVDATSFFGKIRAKTGITFDLPTEAQWEYTCRAGTGSALNNGKNLEDGFWYRGGSSSAGRYYYQSAPASEVARYSYNSGQSNDSGNYYLWDKKGGYRYATVVGCYKPNAWGFYDMHGNVREWCIDWWQNNLTSSPTTNPVGATSGSYRSIRGGGWNESAEWVRSANRSNYTSPSNRDSVIGFRVAAYPAE